MTLQDIIDRILSINVLALIIARRKAKRGLYAFLFCLPVRLLVCLSPMRADGGGSLRQPFRPHCLFRRLYKNLTTNHKCSCYKFDFISLTIIFIIDRLISE